MGPREVIGHGTAWAIVAACAVMSASVKALGPVAFGGRRLPARFDGVVGLLAPALLAALVATQALADGRHLHVGAQTAGVVASGLVVWRTRSIVAAVVVAAGVTALLRAL